MIVHFVKKYMVGLRDDNNSKTSIVMDQDPTLGLSCVLGLGLSEKSIENWCLYRAEIKGPYSKGPKASQGSSL